MCDIGEKIAPSTPRIVNSGRNAITKMMVEKNIGPPTSCAALRICVRASLVGRVVRRQWRWIFSITITVVSMMMPKSTAPSEIRLAGVPSSMHQRERAEQRQRDIDRRDQRGAQVAQEKQQHQEHQRHPDRQVLEHGMQRGLDQRGAIVIRDDLVTRGQDAGGVEVVDFGLDALERLQRVAIFAHQDDAGDHVVVGSFMPTMPSRGA